MENEYREYATFHITAKDGSDVEMAVVDEFDFEDKHYVVGAVVKDDTILPKRTAAPTHHRRY